MKCEVTVVHMASFFPLSDKTWSCTSSAISSAWAVSQQVRWATRSGAIGSGKEAYSFTEAKTIKSW